MMERLLHNWPAKVLSVFFALILWFFVTGEQSAEVGFAVPLELKNIPKGMMVVNDVPSFVDVRISGPRTILSSLRPSDILVSVDLNGAKAGVTTFRRLEQGVKIPTALKITRLLAVNSGHQPGNDQGEAGSGQGDFYRGAGQGFPRRYG